MTTMQFAIMVSSLGAAMLAAALGQDWVRDQYLPPIWIEAHRILLLIICCILVYHAFDTAGTSRPFLVIAMGAIYALRIVSRRMVEHNNHIDARHPK
jgi:hypothetical protein